MMKKEFKGIIYQTYSEIELLDLTLIKTAVINKEPLSFIDFSTILSTFEGHTIFSIFAD